MNWDQDPSMKTCLNIAKAIKDMKKSKEYFDSLAGAPDLIKEKARMEYKMPRSAPLPGKTVADRALWWAACIGGGPVGNVYCGTDNFVKINLEEEDNLRIEICGDVYFNQVGFNPKKYDALLKIAEKLDYEVTRWSGESIRLSPRGGDKKNSLFLDEYSLMVPMNVEPKVIMKIVEKVYTK